jgi:hypothetical protein
MKASDVFGILVRLYGLALLTYSVWYVFGAIDQIVNGGQPSYPVGSYLIHSLWMSIVGLYFLRGAPHLLGFAYPTDARMQESQVEDEWQPKP